MIYLPDDILMKILEGYKEYVFLPAEEKFSFYHPKDIAKQELQNEFYKEINK